jgi:ferritin-like metal-binding protein YciE
MEFRDTLIAWLNDAYAMEESLVPVLENHAKDAKAFPAVQARIQEHADETRQQAERVKLCLEELGEKPSAAKSALGKVFGTLHAPGTGMYDDELVKNALMDFATEAFEMACYEALAVAAQDGGHERIAELCRQNFAEEEAMAEWLREQLPETVRNYCHETASATTRA